MLDFDNGRHCSGMDVSELPSFGRNRMVSENDQENESPAGAFLHFLLIFYLFFIGDRASFSPFWAGITGRPCSGICTKSWFINFILDDMEI